MAVTVYRWDDASAPSLTGVLGSLIALLDACLVSGYGSKSPAGWTKPYTGTNIAVFRAGGGNQRYLRVADTNTTFAMLRGYGAMTDANDSGTDPFPTSAQAAAGLHHHKSTTADTTARPWVVIADNTRFYLVSSGSVTTATGLQGASNIANAHGTFFGDIVSYVPSDARHTALMAGTSNGATGSFGLVAASNTTCAGCFIERDYTQTGTSLNFGRSKSGRSDSTTIGAAGGAYPDPAHGGINLDPVYVHEPSTRVIRGHLPGLWNPAHTRPGTPMDTFTGKTGTAMAGKTFVILPVYNSSTGGHMCIETSDTWG